jgi:alginate O-acetyltransferase complex protein AlgI
VLFDVARIAIFFMVISYGWLLFRAPSLDKIASLTSTLIFDFGNLDYGAAWPRLAAIIGLPILFVIELVEKLDAEKPFYKILPVPAWTALYAAMIFNIAIGMTTESTQFIYMVF